MLSFTMLLPLFSVVIAVICATISLVFFICIKANKSLHNEHILVTGGSSGIGLAFAMEAAKRGASVTILARNKEQLQKAKAEILPCAINPEQKIEAVQGDVTGDCEFLQNIVNEAETHSGPITFLANCAGTSVCYRFEETPRSEFERMLNTNFMGSVNITQTLVPLMKERKKGNIVFCSSMAGLVGLYGYSAYSASKFALVGMAEALQMEVKPYNIAVTVSFPPDTDTPGYAEEIKTKLRETHLISESGGLFSARDVASKTLNDALNGRFMSSLGFEGWLIATLCCGMTPASFFDFLLQVLSMGFCRLIGFTYIRNCDRTIKKCAQEKKS